MKEYNKNKTDTIIKIVSYLLAIIIIIYSVKNYDNINYQELFINIGKVGLCILGVVILVVIIVVICKKFKEHKDE